MLRALHAALWLLVLTSCAATSVPDRQAPGWPTWPRVQGAVLDAARSPVAWGPLLAAGLLQIGDADREISDWAADHTPIFGSEDAADTASDVLRWTTAGAYAATVIVVPQDSGAARPGPLKTLAVGGMAELTNVGVTQGLKRATARERPDASNDRSFPSQHASSSALFATLGSREIETRVPPETRRDVLRWGFGGMAAATAWARVEGREHFPSDVLVGAALGHFLGAIFHSAFLGERENARIAPHVAISAREWYVAFRAVF